MKRTLRDSKQNTSFKEVRFMSMVKEALRTEETQTNEGRTVAGIVNSIETLEGGGISGAPAVSQGIVFRL